jgi:hypothetical protein
VRVTGGTPPRCASPPGHTGGPPVLPGRMAEPLCSSPDQSWGQVHAAVSPSSGRSRAAAYGHAASHHNGMTAQQQSNKTAEIGSGRKA